MKILFVCAAGGSTGLIVKKMHKWAESQNIDLVLNAVGVSEYQDVWQEYECILVGPQVRYKLNDIKKDVTIPVSQIDPYDYAVQDVDKMLRLAMSLIENNG